jgi:hypothetical protein
MRAGYMAYFLVSVVDQNNWALGAIIYVLYFLRLKGRGMVSLSKHTLEMSIGIRKSRSIFYLVIKPCFENVTYFYFT